VDIWGIWGRWNWARSYELDNEDLLISILDQSEQNQSFDPFPDPQKRALEDEFPLFSYDFSLIFLHLKCHFFRFLPGAHLPGRLDRVAGVGPEDLGSGPATERCPRLVRPLRGERCHGAAA